MEELGFRPWRGPHATFQMPCISRSLSRRAKGIHHRDDGLLNLVFGHRKVENGRADVDVAERLLRTIQIPPRLFMDDHNKRFTQAMCPTSDPSSRKPYRHP
jgi:hypothetical protein